MTAQANKKKNDVSRREFLKIGGSSRDDIIGLLTDYVDRIGANLFGYNECPVEEALSRICHA